VVANIRERWAVSEKYRRNFKDLSQETNEVGVGSIIRLRLQIVFAALRT